MSTRVLIADDHAMLREGLRLLIDAQEDMSVVGEVADTTSVVDATRKTEPDVLLLDISMPGGGGLSAIDALRASGLSPRVLVLTMHEQAAYLRQAMAKGVSGYLVKRVASEQLIQAIRAVREGRIHIDATIQNGDSRAVLDTNPECRELLESLSPREREVLLLVAGGHTNQEAAERLAISVKTVEGYRARVMRKIGARNRADLVRFAIEVGWLDRP